MDYYNNISFVFFISVTSSVWEYNITIKIYYYYYYIIIISKVVIDIVILSLPEYHAFLTTDSHIVCFSVIADQLLIQIFSSTNFLMYKHKRE